MKRSISYFFGIIGSLILIISLLFTSIEFSAMDLKFYETEYSKLDTASSIGMKHEALMDVTGHLLGYLRGAEDSLVVKAAVHGKTRTVFGKRDRDHMVDVRNLFLFWRDARNVGMVAVALFIVLILLLVRRDPLRVYAKSYLIASIIAGVLFAAMGAWIAADFNSFWYSFHLLFFTNDLWLLDPATSILIQMVPEQFFFDICVRIITMFVVAAGVLFAASLVYLLVNRHRRNVLLSIRQDGEGGRQGDKRA